MGFATLLNNATLEGPGSALDCRNAKKASFAVTGDFVATVTFGASLDGINYYPYVGAGNGETCTSLVVPGLVTFPDAEAIAYIRPNVQMYLGGAITVVGYTETRVDELMNYAHFNAVTAGTQIKTDPGVLHSVNIGDAGSAMTVFLYDGTATSDPLIGVFKTAGSFVLDVAFTKGLFIVIAATTPGDVCISYK